MEGQLRGAANGLGRLARVLHPRQLDDDPPVTGSGQRRLGDPEGVDPFAQHLHDPIRGLRVRDHGPGVTGLQHDLRAAPKVQSQADRSGQRGQQRRHDHGQCEDSSPETRSIRPPRWRARRAGQGGHGHGNSGVEKGTARGPASGVGGRRRTRAEDVVRADAAAIAGDAQRGDSIRWIARRSGSRKSRGRPRRSRSTTVRSRRHPPEAAHRGRERHSEDQQHGDRLHRPPGSTAHSSGATRANDPLRSEGNRRGQVPGSGVIHPVSGPAVAGLCAINQGSGGGSPRRARPSSSRPPQPQRRGKGEQRHCDCATTSDPPHPSRLCEPRTWTKRHHPMPEREVREPAGAGAAWAWHQKEEEVRERPVPLRDSLGLPSGFHLSGHPETTSSSHPSDTADTRLG